jgi:hypothetical protein
VISVTTNHVRWTLQAKWGAHPTSAIGSEKPAELVRLQSKREAGARSIGYHQLTALQLEGLVEQWLEPVDVFYRDAPVIRSAWSRE